MNAHTASQDALSAILRADASALIEIQPHELRGLGNDIAELSFPERQRAITAIIDMLENDIGEMAMSNLIAGVFERIELSDLELLKLKNLVRQGLPHNARSRAMLNRFVLTKTIDYLPPEPPGPGRPPHRPRALAA